MYLFSFGDPIRNRNAFTSSLLLHRRALFRLRCQDKGIPLLCRPPPAEHCAALTLPRLSELFHDKAHEQNTFFFVSPLSDKYTQKYTGHGRRGSDKTRNTKISRRKRINVNKIFPPNSPDPKSWYLQTGGRRPLPASPSSPGEEGKKGGASNN